MCGISFSGVAARLARMISRGGSCQTQWRRGHQSANRDVVMRRDLDISANTISAAGGRKLAGGGSEEVNLCRP